MPKDQDRLAEKYLKYSGLGVELAASVAVFCLIGYFVDERWGTSPIGLITGAIIGIVGGMYLLIKEAFLMDKALGRKGREHEHGREHETSDDKRG